MTHKDDLERLRRRRERHAADALEIRQHTAEAITAALEAGMTGKEIADALRVSHQHVYKLAAQEGRKE